MIDDGMTDLGELQATANIVEPVLVGRAGEFNTLASRSPADDGKRRFVVLSAAPGRGCTSLLAAAALHLARESDTAILRCAPLQPGGAPRLYRIGPDSYQQRWESSSEELIEQLRCLVEDGVGAVVVDDLHRLDVVAAERLVSLAAGWAALGAEIRIGVQPCMSEGGDPCLAELSGRSWMTLSPLSDDDLWQVLTCGLGAALDQQRDLLLAVCQGSPGMAVRLRESLRRTGLRPGTQPAPAVVVGVAEDVVAERLRSQLPRSAEVRALAAASALIWPEGELLQAAQLIGSPRTMADLYRDRFVEIGLYPRHPRAADVVRRAAFALVDPIATTDIEGQALSYLERHGAGPARRLEILEILGRYDGRYFELALQVVAEARERGDLPMLGKIADSVLLQATNREQAQWGREILLEYAKRCDWGEAARLLGPYSGQGTLSAAVQMAGLSPLFAVEYPFVARRLVRQLIEEDASGTRSSADVWCTATQLWLLAGCDPMSEHNASTYLTLLRHASGPGASDEARSGVRLTRLVALAFRGATIERVLANVTEELQHSFAVAGMCPVVAALLAAAHLALDDLETALSWARIATSQASERHQAEGALASWVAAQALLRVGDGAGAGVAAATAQRVFAALGAHRLADAAAATVVHAGLVPENQPTTTSSIGIKVVGEDGHGLLRGYGAYVAGRTALAQGWAQDGVDQLFLAGRALHTAGICNPTVVAWRAHVATVFRASHDDRLADWMTADMTDAVLRWQRSNPVSGQRRAVRLQEAAGGGPVGERDAAMAARAATVSDAELRVVRLVLEGRGNADVAAHLFLSKRTVDTHLTNVYRKLGIASRHELAAAMTGICAASDHSQERAVPESSAQTTPVGR